MEQSGSVLFGSDAWRILRRGADVSELPAGVSESRSRTFRTRPASLPPFRHSQPCRWQGFLDQVIGTALLVLLIFALSDENNIAPPPQIAPLLVGLVVVLIGMSFGGMHGYAINPARDFGPRTVHGSRRVPQ